MANLRRSAPPSDGVTRRGPGLCFSVILRWQPDAEYAASSLSVLDDLFSLRLPYLANAGKKRPLVGPGNKGTIEKDGVVLFARTLLER